MATFVCVCRAVNIDFITSPSLCLSVAGAQRGWGWGGLVHTVSRTQQSPHMYVSVEGGGGCLPSDIETWRWFLALSGSQFDRTWMCFTKEVKRQRRHGALSAVSLRFSSAGIGLLGNQDEEPGQTCVWVGVVLVCKHIQYTICSVRVC